MSIFSFLSNPIALAAVTVAAIGVIVYQIINQQEERAHTRGRDNRRPPGSCNDSSSTSYTDRRPPGSCNDSSSTSYRPFESDVRRRKPDEISAKPGSNNNIKQERKISSDETDTKKSSFNEEQYRRNVFDKIEKDVKNFDQRDVVLKKFDKNIDVSNGDETDDSENLDDTKVINVSNANHPGARTRYGSSSNDARGKNGQESKLTNSNLSISSSDVAGTSNQDMTRSKCRACEEVPANAVAFPCNHCYLCYNCAVMVFRIYKRCTICDSLVEKFQVLTN